MRILKLKVKNERLAQSLLQLVSRYPDIEMLENTEIKEEVKISKLDALLNKPYEKRDFRIFTRTEIYER